MFFPFAFGVLGNVFYITFPMMLGSLHFSTSEFAETVHTDSDALPGSRWCGVDITTDCLRAYCRTTEFDSRPDANTPVTRQARGRTTAEGGKVGKGPRI